ncbi:MSMEG_0570 family nitrogen starvation response protein [Nocardioides sp. TF02-7]|uniref:MSMEG_0570 family nitrogen starvation response protein n=1 Tax=Nocardioides sp. TF02-7 TaxID=2917724 RepID=UPI001F06EA05|nr:MSMEG_0570 family nitrogen starvation response protein [Nocardioides sp. TF02-7]UMG93012.1 MSMEG_0570 family nitrogen starvation response protein [Nocardioides sp. TF02-7]
MPEMTFTVRWPDGEVDDCYSPSLVVHDHLTVGRYAVAEFRRRATAALDEAGERVRARYGFACTSAAATREHVERRAASFPPNAVVTVLRLHPPLPEAGS